MALPDLLTTAVNDIAHMKETYERRHARLQKDFDEYKVATAKTINSMKKELRLNTKVLGKITLLFGFVSATGVAIGTYFENIKHFFAGLGR